MCIRDRSSLELAFAVGIASTVLGALYGAMSGVIGGFGDAILMRIIDTLLAVPTFILLIIVASMYTLSLEAIILILTLLSWPSVARLVRGQVPVSYTHLDVYKRQVLRRRGEVHRQPAGEPVQLAEVQPP